MQSSHSVSALMGNPTRLPHWPKVCVLVEESKGTSELTQASESSLNKIKG